MLIRATFYSEEGDFTNAQKDLNEVFDIADYSGMKLFLCDYHLETARLNLALATTDSKTVIGHYEKAKQLINDTDYHRRDRELAELEKAIHKNH